MDAALQKELFDIAKVLIDRLSSWPAVVIMFVLLFRKQLESAFQAISATANRIVESLLSRGFKFGFDKGGIKLEAEAVIAVTAQEKLPDLTVAKGLVINTAAPTAPLSTRLQTLQAVGVSPIAVEQASIIRRDLETLGINQTETIDLLIKHLAATQLVHRAEVVYRTIFGSQIAILKFLNTNRRGLPKDRLLNVYDRVKAQFPVLYSTYTFEQYLSYMVSQGLILSETVDQFTLTIAGREFLKWMADMGLSEDKPF
jgi:hypothetical protein